MIDGRYVSGPQWLALHILIFKTILQGMNSVTNKEDGFGNSSQPAWRVPSQQHHPLSYLRFPHSPGQCISFKSLCQIKTTEEGRIQKLKILPAPCVEYEMNR